jgi:large subunit ribosomal protein L13Ae
MGKSPVVVDCRAHLLGRLASVIAKQLLLGQRVVAVRCDLLEVSGSLRRNQTKYSYFLNKTTRTNAKRGPFHLRAPSKILWRTVRGMLPHKTVKGKTALNRLTVFEGIPAPYDTMKRVVVPQAMRAIR